MSFRFVSFVKPFELSKEEEQYFIENKENCVLVIKYATKEFFIKSSCVSSNLNPLEVKRRKYIYERSEMGQLCLIEKTLLYDLC